MEANNRQAAYQSLISLADKQGYVTFDDIMRCADDYSLPIQDFDWLSNAITTRGVLVYSENPNTQSANDDEYDDYAQSDYEAVYNKIIEICPSLELFVTQVRNTLPPQYGEISRLKYQIVDGNLHARNRMIEMHLRIALRIALGRAELHDADLEDTVSDACIGLIYAVDKYDPDTSGAFASYASLWILQNVSRAQATQRPLMYYPVHRKEGYFAIYPLAKDRGCVGCDKMLSCHDLRKFISEKLNCSNTSAEHIIYQMLPFNSLSELIEEDIAEQEEHTNNLMDALQYLAFDEENEVLEQVCNAQLSKTIDTVLATLSSKEAEVIRMRYGFYGNAMTLEEVGQKYNVTRERIRQIEVKALRKLKHKPLLKELSEYY